jgi:hypothetical protein
MRRPLIGNNGQRAYEVRIRIQMRVRIFYCGFPQRGLENNIQNKYHRKWLLALNTIEC